MQNQVPARIGDCVENVLTPALLVDLDLLEANILDMAAYARVSGVSLRPHGKAHKCVEIAKRQIAAGAVGICCQKVSELEAFIAGGITDVLLTNEIVQPYKAERLAHIARQARVAVCVDHPDQLRLLARAARDAQSRVGAFVEVNVGHSRCGVTSDEGVLQLAGQIAASDVIEFRGLQAYHGTAQHIRQLDDRSGTIAAVVARVAALRVALLRAGIECPSATGGGTGTWNLESLSGTYTEIQPGSYVFMDADYARNESPPPFRHSLVIRSTVMSVAVPGQVAVDAGYKAMAVDSGRPRPLRQDLEVLGMSDEHTVLRQSPHAPVNLGDTVDFIPGHIDPTVNLHDWYVCVRRGRVEAVWPVAARGPGL